MAEVKIFLNGRSYDIACDAGQEGHIVDLAAYVDQRVQALSRSGAAYNEAHLMALATLIVADELFAAREGAPAQKPAKAAAQAQAAVSKDEEATILRVVETLTKRIDGIASKVLQAS